MSRGRLLGTVLFSVSAGILSLAMIKSHYGGTISIRLNEPSSLRSGVSSYSNLIFFSLIHENFFYLNRDGYTRSNLFAAPTYQAERKALTLKLKKNLSFSNGKPVANRHIILSLNLFLNQNLVSAKRIREIIKSIHAESDQIVLELLYDRPDIIGLLTAPELILVNEDERVFSGPFVPLDWVKEQSVRLRANHYYPGGRPYLDEIRVVFDKGMRPQIFLGHPATFPGSRYREMRAGIFQNTYLCFPQGKVGGNTRGSLYQVLRQFLVASGQTELNSIVSDDESPVAIEINAISNRRVRSILRYSNLRLYILSSLKHIESPLQEFLSEKGLRLEPLFIDENQLVDYMNNTNIDVLLLEKVFNQRMPLEEKLKKVIREISFGRFNAHYLKRLEELDEVAFLKQENLLIEQIARIEEEIVNDGFLLPLAQKRYSLYIDRDVRGVAMDYYSRPLLVKASLEPSL